MNTYEAVVVLTIIKISTTTSDNIKILDNARGGTEKKDLAKHLAKVGYICIQDRTKI